MASQLKKFSKMKMISKTKKFLLNCQEIVDVSGVYPQEFLQILKKIQQTNILIGNMSIGVKKQIVVKFGDENTIQKEYQMSKMLYQENIYNIVKSYCTFHCLEDITKFNKIESVEHSTALCSKTGKRTWFVIFPYYQMGSIGLYKWTDSNFNVLKNIVKQVILSLYSAYISTGFVHMDLHLGNVLISKTKKKNVLYKNTNLLLDLIGYKAVIIDFEKSDTSRDEKNSKQSLYKLANNLRDPSENGDIIIESHPISTFIRNMDISDNSIKELINHVSNMTIDYIKT